MSGFTTRKGLKTLRGFHSHFGSSSFHSRAEQEAGDAPSHCSMGGGGKGGYGKWNGGGNNQLMQMISAMMGPYGKGKGGGGKGKGLRDFKHDVKVWIGGLPADSCSKELNMKLKAGSSRAL